MQSLKTHHFFHTTHTAHGHRTTSGTLHFAPVANDGDELIQDINTTAEKQDDTWQLTPTPDSNQLEQFWNKVSQDVHSDPTWVDFAEE